MKLVKVDGKNKTVTSKITDAQNEKLLKLAEKIGITKSNLINQLITEGFKQATGNTKF